jgi:hypothetical protein
LGGRATKGRITTAATAISPRQISTTPMTFAVSMVGLLVGAGGGGNPRTVIMEMSAFI